VYVLSFPREALSQVMEQKESLERYVQAHSHTLSHSRFSGAAWNLETVAIDDLLAKIRHVGMPLTEFAGVKPYRGVLTGLNEAFLIDTPTRDRLVREDPRCAEIIKPSVRGQDIKRWSPEWANVWMIFARRGMDIDAYPAVKQHLLQYREKLAPRPEVWAGVWGGRKTGSYNWYELQDAIEYWPLFEQPKIITQDLTTYSWFSFDTRGFYPVNTCYIWPTSDFYILGWLCSPIAWWICHRILQHSIHDTLRMFGEQAQTLPIALPTDAVRSEVEQVVARLIELTQVIQEARLLMLDWLRVEFKVQEPGKRLEHFFELDRQIFVEEVRKRRAKMTHTLTPAALRALQAGYTEQLAPIQHDRTEAEILERRLSELINTTYGLTPEEVALLWETAPPRMPLKPQEREFQT
jgi:hypothetical protein